jgi:hypothetical protein
MNDPRRSLRRVSRFTQNEWACWSSAAEGDLERPLRTAKGLVEIQWRALV